MIITAVKLLEQGQAPPGGKPGPVKNPVDYYQKRVTHDLENLSSQNDPEEKAPRPQEQPQSRPEAHRQKPGNIVQALAVFPGSAGVGNFDPPPAAISRRNGVRFFLPVDPIRFLYFCLKSSYSRSTLNRTIRPFEACCLFNYRTDEYVHGCDDSHRVAPVDALERRATGCDHEDAMARAIGTGAGAL